MEKAKYSGRYNGKDPSKLDGAPDPNWYSEYLAHMPNYKDLTAPPLYNEFPTNLEERKHLWDNQISFDIELNAISKFEDPRKNSKRLLAYNRVHKLQTSAPRRNVLFS